MNNMNPLLAQLQMTMRSPQFQAAMQNPVAFATEQLGRSISNPNEVIQQLMNTGRLSQTQYNQLVQLGRQMQNSAPYGRGF